MSQQIFGNAQIVLRDEVIRGSLVVEDGLISAIDTARNMPAGALDLEGDILIPGLVDLHSDHLEKHVSPRPGVFWHATSAAISYDAQVISSGITTMFDSFGLVGEEFDADRNGALERMVTGIRHASGQGFLRAEHFTHLRCEIIEPDAIERFNTFRNNPSVRLVSVMDHTPGQRTFPDVEKWKAYQRTRTGASVEQLDTILEARQQARARYADVNRRVISDLCVERGIVVASHDDTTVDEVCEAKQLGHTISEFPTSRAAAAEAKRLGLSILMGAPNLVRGKSHIGNLSASDCARADMLDILASDYIPSSLLHAAFLLTDESIGWDLPKAMATVSATPAGRCNLDDRGEIAIAKRADLVRIKVDDRLPVIRAVWRSGQKVF